MNDHIEQITEASFGEMVEGAKTLVLLDFWASWCGPCKQIAPHIDELASEYAGRVLVGKIDTEANRALAKRFAVASIPTLILMKDGQEIARLAGRTKTRLAAALDAYL